MDWIDDFPQAMREHLRHACENENHLYMNAIKGRCPKCKAAAMWRLRENAKLSAPPAPVYEYQWAYYDEGARFDEVSVTDCYYTDANEVRRAWAVPQTINIRIILGRLTETRRERKS